MLLGFEDSLDWSLGNNGGGGGGVDPDAEVARLTGAAGIANTPSSPFFSCSGDVIAVDAEPADSDVRSCAS